MQHVPDHTHAPPAPTHTHTEALLPGSDSKCELGPQRVIIQVSIIELTNSSKAHFILIWLLFPARFNDNMTPLVLSGLSWNNCGLRYGEFLPRVLINHGPDGWKRRLHADGEAALCCFNRVRQFQGNNSFGQWGGGSGGHREASLSLSQRGNTEGFISVWSVILRPSSVPSLSLGDDLETPGLSPSSAFDRRWSRAKKN